MTPEYFWDKSNLVELGTLIEEAKRTERAQQRAFDRAKAGQPQEGERVPARVEDLSEWMGVPVEVNRRA